MKDIIFFTIASDKFMPYAQSMSRSFLKFHPDYKIRMFVQKDINEARVLGWRDGLYGYFGSKLASENKLVVKLDADCIITGRLDEIISGEYDIAAPLNNDPDYSFCGLDQPKYVTASIVASHDPTFWHVWKHFTRLYEALYPLWEQDILNLLFHFHGWKGKILDSNISLYGNGRGKWSSYKVEEDRIMCEGKQVKVVHWAGGNSMKKLNYRDQGHPFGNFTEEVCRKFDKLVA